MTDQQIQCFLAVVRTGSISGAAQTLYVTQPAASRCVRTLEEELGYPLFRRGKGQRRVELTDHGRAFIAVAEKWRILWKETQELARQDENSRLVFSSVGSVSSCLLPQVLRRFLEGWPQCSLTFHHYSSFLSYDYVAGGLVDLALISDDRYVPGVETVPAFREPMILAAAKGLELPELVHPAQLDPRRELRLPWNPEYDLWHDFWFQASDQPRATLDMMPILEQLFLWEQCWAVVPLSVGRRLVEKAPVRLHRLEEGPPERIIYYLQGRRRKPELVRGLLACLREELAQYDEIEVFL